jgi:hypothetical protein
MKLCVDLETDSVKLPPANGREDATLEWSSELRIFIKIVFFAGFLILAIKLFS